MNKEVYRRLSKAERKLKNTNRLRTNNSTLRIKYEGIKKLLEKKDKEIERLNNRLKTSNGTCNYLRNTIDKAIEYMDRRDLEWGSDEHNKMMDILKGSDKE